MTTDLHQEILIAEYNQKWEYVRHGEMMENANINWYLGLSGAFIAILLQYVVDGPLKTIVLGFLVVYSILISFLLLNIKKNRLLYRARLRQIDGIRNFLDESAMDAGKQKEYSKWIGAPVFNIRFYIALLMGVFITGLFVYEIMGLALGCHGLPHFQILLTAIVPIMYFFYFQEKLKVLNGMRKKIMDHLKQGSTDAGAD